MACQTTRSTTAPTTATKRLQTLKPVIPAGSEIINVIGEMAGVLPLAEGTRGHRVGGQDDGLAALVGQAAQRGVKPSVPRDENRLQPMP